ncbi:alpha DNA polymerase [Gymnopilus junonius]|uniref:DNA polymerase alpha subunit B n=1 Tax=Gymnopilus junonius TaxID=109634 RepID=A0A9P5TLM8_GYMJU|nr:alpha DNA polymerase [Gymnopilus junonius]
MATSLTKEIERDLSANGHILDDKLLDECVTICTLYNLSAEDLRFKIEAANYNASAIRSGFSPITADTLAEVKKKIQAELTKDRAKTKPKGSAAAQVNLSRLSNYGRNTTVSSSAVSNVKQEVDALESSWIPSINNIRTTNVTFVGPPNDFESRKKRAYRYMFEKISERSENLDQIIDDFAELIRAHYDVSDFGDPSASTDGEITIVGRITHDTDTASSSKLAEGAMMIESSRMLSGGARVPLALDPTIKIRGSVKGIGGFGLYPGEIVALKGKNGGGGYFLATEVLGIPPLKPSPAAQGIIDPKVDPGASQNPATMFVVCGPFTMDSDTAYKPWRALLHIIKSQKPDVVLLVGPFVDAQHPKIKIGDLEVSTTNLFRAHILDPLKAFLTASPGSIMLMVPSVRDLTSAHAAFPQPEFDNENLSHPRIHLLPNPARFTINDISFGVTSVDTLFHLRKEEYFKRGIEADPLPAATNDLPNDALANFFYPIFPPPADMANEVNLDVSHFDAARMVDEGDLDYAPDVLILPSRLKQFSKVIHSTTALNTSFLSKGTYGTISIAPRSAGTPLNRLKVEVTKLESTTSTTNSAAAATSTTTTTTATSS